MGSTYFAKPEAVHTHIRHRAPNGCIPALPPVPERAPPVSPGPPAATLLGAEWSSDAERPEELGVLSANMFASRRQRPQQHNTTAEGHGLVFLRSEGACGLPLAAPEGGFMPPQSPFSLFK